MVCHARQALFAAFMVYAFNTLGILAKDPYGYALSSLNLDGYVADLLANDVLLGTSSEYRPSCSYFGC